MAVSRFFRRLALDQFGRIAVYGWVALASLDGMFPAVHEMDVFGTRPNRR